MAGPSLSPEAMRDAFVDRGTNVLATVLRAHPLWFEGIFDTGPITAISDPEYGDVSTTLVFGDDLEEYTPGQNVTYTTGVQGWAPQGALRRFKKAISIPMSDLRAANGLARGTDIVAEFVNAQALNWQNKKNKLVADIFARGGITAGDVNVFKASYTNRAASFDGFVYDGKPLFANDHPLKAPKSSTTVYNNLHSTSGTTLDASGFNAVYERLAQANALSEQGEKIDIRPTWLLVPHNLRQNAFGVLTTQNVPGTANMEENVNKGIMQHRVVPFFTSTTAWYMVGDPGCIRIRDSGPLRFRSWENEESDSMSFEVSGAFLAYPRDAKHVVGVNVATS